MESCVSGTILEPGQIEASASKPPFIQLPPRNLFALRAARLEHYADGHALGAYLKLLAALCHAQQQVLDAPPEMPALDAHRIEQSLTHDLPPLAADTLVREDAWLRQLDALLAAFAAPTDNTAVAGPLGPPGPGGAGA